jgi:alpha-beta hydrolase superfamily lysophospholipase
MTLRRRLVRILLILLLLPPILAGIAGWLVAPGFLHPIRRELTPDLIREADASFAHSGGHREDFNVRAPDGVTLCGWLARPDRPNGNWVLLFHGVADNRVGVAAQSEFLLRAGYSVVMMDARAHGASEGQIGTYGWLEGNDTKSIIDALLALVRRVRTDFQMQPGYRPPNSLGNFPVIYPHPPVPPTPHIFALGESMGAGIALQSAAVDPRIEGVVAEASFANLREATYDYAGLRRSPLLGKTLFAPFSWMLLYRGEKLTASPSPKSLPRKPSRRAPSQSSSSAMKKTRPFPAATQNAFTPRPSGPNNSGKSPAPSTPLPSASSQPSFSAASSTFTLT